MDPDLANGPISVHTRLRVFREPNHIGFVKVCLTTKEDLDNM